MSKVINVVAIPHFEKNLQIQILIVLFFRRRLQLTALVRLFTIVDSLQNANATDNFPMGAGTERWAAKEAEYLTFFLTQNEQIL
jgi:hypothetical protein